MHLLIVPVEFGHFQPATIMFLHTVTQVIPYITFGETHGVVTQAVPDFDDGTSAPIFVSFPLGSHNNSTVYVSKVSTVLLVSYK